MALQNALPISIPGNEFPGNKIDRASGSFPEKIAITQSRRDGSFYNNGF
jgi:hypothetical protein